MAGRRTRGGDLRAMAPPLDRIDHVHVFVSDRVAAEAWYGRVLGLERVRELAHWAQGGGPLTLADAGGKVHIALFESAHGSAQDPHESRRAQNRATIAFGVDAAAFRDWQDHLAVQLGRTVDVVDHGEASSLYVKDADGNPFEITCYA